MNQQIDDKQNAKFMIFNIENCARADPQIPDQQTQKIEKIKNPTPPNYREVFNM